MKNNMISIVIPVYNVAHYLPDCMESVLSQTDENVEVILVDDGSTDNSGILCDRYSEEYTSIKVIHQKNAGLSAARNSGIEIAQGEYITFIDSDDMLAPNFIKTALALAEAHKADFVAFGNVRCEANAHYNSEYKIAMQSEINTYFDKTIKMQRFLIGTEIGTTAWAKLYRTELFKSIRYPVGKYHEDVFTTYKLVDKASRIVTTSQVGYIYRKNPNSITTRKFSEKRLDSVIGKKQQLAFICENYPRLQKEAETGVIYACNQCLMLMAKAAYTKKLVLEEFQILYRKYGWSYLSSHVSTKGKIVVLISMLNIKLAFTLLKFV